MLNLTQYVVVDPFQDRFANVPSLENHLSTIGFERGSFTITTEDDGKTRLKFWEQDRVKALGFLEKLDGLS